MSKLVFRQIIDAAVAIYTAALVPSLHERKIEGFLHAWRQAVQSIKRLVQTNSLGEQETNIGSPSEQGSSTTAPRQNDMPLSVLAKEITVDERVALKALGAAVALYTRGGATSGRWTRRIPIQQARYTIYGFMVLIGRIVRDRLAHQQTQCQSSELDRTLCSSQIHMEEFILPEDDCQYFMAFLRAMYEIWGERFPEDTKPATS